MKKTGPKHQQRIPIPSDWNGEDWFCIQLQWPKSPEWIAVLTGILSNLTRGWYWNEQTGTVTDAQVIGREIFLRNIIFNPCSSGENGGEIPGDETPCQSIGNFGSDYDQECDEMPAVTWLDYDENGNLRMWFGPCCSQLVMGTTQDTQLPDPYADDDTVSYASCGKADALVDALWSVLDAGWDAQNSANPFTWVGTVEAALPGYNLSDNAIWSLVQQSIDLDNDYSKAEVLTDYRKQQLKCLAQSIFNDDPGGITQIEYDQWRGLSAVVFIGEQRQWAQTGMEAIGKGNSSTIAALGATNESADCECPGELGTIIGPTSGGWYLDLPQTLEVDCAGGFGTTWADFKEISAHDTYGVMYYCEYVSGDPINNIKRGPCQDPQPDFCFGQASSDTWSENISYCQMGASAYAQLSPLLPSPTQSTLGTKQSDVVASPSAPGGDEIGVDIGGQAQGDPASVRIRFTIRWLRNTGSPSHS